MTQPLIAVSADIREFERYVWHAVPAQYLKAALHTAGVLPLMVPSFGEAIDFDGLLANVDGVMLTGSKTNVHPTLYGKEATEANGPYDEARDATTLPLIRRAIARGVPVLAICRGLQELNVAMGGTLAAEIQDQPGMMDHRAAESDDQDERFAIHQKVRIAEGTCMADIFGAGDIKVNSLHRQAIDRVAPNLAIEAVAPDGTVEAVSVIGASAFAVGVQWHPEYWAHSDDSSARIFHAFGDAVRAHRDARLGMRPAAE